MKRAYVVRNEREQWVTYAEGFVSGVEGPSILATATFHASKALEAWEELNRYAERYGAMLEPDMCAESFAPALEADTLAREVEKAMGEHGFALTDTGGGIEQFVWCHEPTGRYVIITTPDGEVPPAMASPVIVGNYMPDGEKLGDFQSYESLTDALIMEERPT